MDDPTLLGFSFDVSDGRKFHCLSCVTARTDARATWREQRALAIVEFPALQKYSWTYSFARALRVVRAGSFGTRLYAVDDEGLNDDLRR